MRTLREIVKVGDIYDQEWCVRYFSNTSSGQRLLWQSEMLPLNSELVELRVYDDEVDDCKVLAVESVYRVQE